MFESEEERIKIEFEKYRDTLLAEAGRKYELVSQANLQFHRTLLHSFCLFQTLRDVEVDQVWEVRSGSHYFVLYSLGIVPAFRAGRSGDSRERHLHFFGRVEGRTDFGDCILQPETLQLKIQDFFHPVEIDFNRNPAFSAKYYCLAKDPLRFRKAMTTQLMDYMTTLKDMEMECHQQSWLFKTSRSLIDSHSNAQMFDIGIELTRLLNQ